MNSAEYRQRWQELHPGQTPRKGQKQVPDGGPLKLQVNTTPQVLDKDAYKKAWLAERRNNLEPASQRKQWGSPLKLSPRGGLDTDAIIRDVQREKEQEDYRREWEKSHGKSNKRGYQPRPTLGEQTDEYKASLANESDNAKWQKIKARNDEYNEFLAKKGEQSRRRFEDKKQPPETKGSGIFNTIPGLRYSNSAQRRNQEEERNREYNEMLKQKAMRGARRVPVPDVPKQGWMTPDYQDILDQKRVQEGNYRRANDLMLDSEATKNYKDTVSSGSGDQLPPRARGILKQGDYYASLPLGQDKASAQQRQKEEYKRDLQRQMAEAANARKIERKEGLQVNNTGLANDTPRIRFEQKHQRTTNREDPYQSLLSHLDNEISPRSNAILGRRQEYKRESGLNLGPSQSRVGVDMGQSLLDMNILANPRPSTLDAPAGLQYQPS